MANQTLLESFPYSKINGTFYQVVAKINMQQFVRLNNEIFYGHF